MSNQFREMRFGRTRLLALCLVMLTAAACDQLPGDQFMSTVVERHKSGQKSVRLGDLTTFKWDRVCYYSPYSASKAHGINNLEREWVLLFFKGGKVVGRTKGDRAKVEIVMGGGAKGNPPCFLPTRTGVLHTERKIPHLTLTDPIK